MWTQEARRRLEGLSFDRLTSWKAGGLQYYFNKEKSTGNG